MEGIRVAQGTGVGEGMSAVVRGATRQAGRTIDRQIETIERIAFQHFPEEEAKRNAYLVELLKQRLREYAAMGDR